jgi:hypothetical protein
MCWNNAQLAQRQQLYAKHWEHVAFLHFPERILTRYANALRDTAEKNIKQYLLLWMWQYVLCIWVTGNCLKLWTKYILEIAQ